jgi:hypothetical protein
MKENKALRTLICLTIILSMAIPPLSTVVRASAVVGLPSQHDSHLYTVGNSSPGVLLTGGWNLISLPIMPSGTSTSAKILFLIYGSGMCMMRLLALGTSTP